MRAVRYHGRGDVRLEEIPEPSLRPGAVRIAPAWTGICGTDLHLFQDGPLPPSPTAERPHPLSGETLPVVLGHEFSGVVLELGEGVEGLSVGEGVVVEPLLVCGACPSCRDGRYNGCDSMGFVGISGGGGGLAEQVVVDRRWVHPVGDLPLDEAALIEPLAVAVHAVRRAGVRAGDVVLVGGAGPIGLLVAAVARGLGATTVVSEVSAARKETALRTGAADVVLDPTQDDVPARVATMTDGRGADVAFVCAGVQPVLDAMVEAVRARGVVQVVAEFGARPAVDLSRVVLRELDVRGAIGYAGDHPTAIALVRDGKVDLRPFISARIEAADVVEQGYRVLVEQRDTVVKVLVRL
ncbi:2,3-butanediol dehydrogenase [Cellulomonas soli]|uniref:2,3-butanediol dehydrogenase n=1 Tax=Cellulomonas soli TaxID=931535 RepID=A0A512PHQ6_9CELL|nr:2,3-butanediol dehydrogenase [Cellulomonas soli]NYI59220.1 (R,R)-butanediol dehydrogenase/meso-butanediol dehydrogenase/diacetyl reductase [Cellulomonas soli]GEP70726.1 2,3-butanediol dehydrogenase [Cellulomonas soli]